jgi:4-amino-4-deoxy-L-arabinose transferase-like glycosyltransferase
MTDQKLRTTLRNCLPEPNVLTLILSLAGIGFFFVPVSMLIEIGKGISPTGSLQAKTLLLFRLLRMAIPLLSMTSLVYALSPEEPRKRIRFYVQRVSRNPWSLPAILVVASLARLVWVVIFPTRPYADSEWYFRTASELAAGYGYVYDLENRKPLAAWPIGYPFFLSLLFRVTGPSEQAAILVNLVLSVLCVALTYSLTLEIFKNQLVAAISASVLATLPGLVVYSSLICTDLLFMCLVTACFRVVVHISEELTLRNAIIAGILNGLSALVRPTGLVLLPIWAVIRWLALHRKYPPYRWILVSTLATAAVVFPWTLRNYRHFGEFIAVSSNGGINFWIGNNPQAFGGFMWPRDETNPLLPLVGNELEISRKGYELGFEFIRQNPLRALKLLPAKVFYLYNSNDFGLHWNKLSAVRPSQFGSGTLAFALVNLAYVIVSVLAATGIIQLLREQRREWLAYSGILLAMYWTIAHLPYFGQDRFVLPLLPVLAMYAAVGIVTILES